MKNVKLLALSAAVAAALSGFSTTAVAGASANVGFASQYYFRGVFQATSSGSAGFDYEHDSGAYVGTWLADVGKGLETDFYVGYAGEMNDISYGAAYIVYDYTDGFDDTYTEVDLTAGYGPISVEFASGQYDGFGTPSDYTFTAITAEQGDFSLTYGSFGNDATGSYFELAYGTQVGGFDAGVSLLSNDSNLDTKAGSQGNGETTLVFSLGKGFDL